MRRKKIHPHSGETLAEILVSALLFLMMMAIMQGAVAFCSNAQRRSGQIRSSNAQICRKLREDGSAGTAKGTKDYTFRATSADGTQDGNVVFTLKDVPLAEKEIADDDGRTVTFCLYGAGGGTP